MYSHAPQDYPCPFCRLAQQTDPYDHARTIYHDSRITAFICRDKWPNNPGHVLIIPNLHYENIYTIPVALGGAYPGMCAGHCPGLQTRVCL